MELQTTVRKDNDSESLKKKRKEEAYFYFKEYCDYSGIHGLRYIAEQRTRCERIWWITALSLSIVFSGAMIYEIIDKYFNNPIITTFSMHEEHIKNIPFPAVTICPVNMISRDYFNLTDAVNRLKNRKGLSEEKLKLYKMATSFCQLPDSILNSFFDNITEQDFYNFLNKSATDIFYRCYFKASHYQSNGFFTPILTEQGVCYSFNILNKTDIFRDDVFSLPGYHHSIYLKRWSGDYEWKLWPYPFRVLVPGPTNGLFIIMATKISDIGYDCRGHKSGYRVAVHSPSSIPDMSEWHFAIPSKQFITGHIMPSLINASSAIKAFSPSTRDCYFDGERYLKYFKIYTLDNCLMECRTNITLEACGCVEFFMPRHNDTPICIEDPDCTMYALSEISPPDLEKKLTDCNCLPTCTDINYNLDISQNNFQSKWIREGYEVSALELYFKRSRIETKERNALYGFSDFVSNFGGLLGLFTGFSMLSLIEIIYFLSLRIWGNKKIYRNWSGKNINDSNDCLY